MTVRRLLAMGASSSRVCGVRDYASVLHAALESRGVEVTTCWWERDAGWGLARSVRELRRWLQEAVFPRPHPPPDRVLWHYSVFTYGHRGIPVLAPLLARSLTRVGAPVVALLHEMAYSFGGRGWRGTTLALTQRAALAGLMRSAAGAIATTEERARWLQERSWLPRRPVAFVPVCPGIPPAAPRPALNGSRCPSIGVFGFGAEGFAPEPVASALARLRGWGLPARLVLVGSPGGESPQASAWSRAAAEAGCADALDFTGTLDPDALAEAIAGLGVLVMPDRGGPSPRKTTMAAALAHGTPVVAFDGPHRWEPLVREGAVVLSPPVGDALAERLEPLLRDGQLRSLQGERGAAFYSRRMAPGAVAEEVLRFLQSVAPVDGEAP